MEWASVVFATYIYLCFFRLLKLRLHVRNQTFLILLSGRSLVQSPPWWCVSNVTLLHTEQRRCTDTQACVSIGLELRERQAWSCCPIMRTSLWRMGHTWRESTAERQRESNIFRTLWNWGRNGHIPRLLSYLSYPVLVYSVWFGSSCNQSSHEWRGKMSFFPCAWVMGTGWDMHRMKQAFATAMALPTTKFGSSKESDWSWVSLNTTF